MSREPQWEGSRISAASDLRCGGGGDADADDDDIISVHRATDGSIDVVAGVADDSGDTQITIVSHVELVYEQNPEDRAEIQALRDLNSSVTTERDDARFAHVATVREAQLEIAELRRQLEQVRGERDTVKRAMRHAMRFAVAAEEQER